MKDFPKFKVTKGSGTANIPHKYEKNACPDSCKTILAESEKIPRKKLSQITKAMQNRTGKKAFIPNFL